MNSLLRSMMAQMESWEAANEFGIPAVSWAEYDARKRSDDLYVCCIATIFDSLRIANHKERAVELDALAKTLVIYSRSAAAKYLSGVEKSLNQLYSASLYYLADRPATATFLARPLYLASDATEEELFLRDFLAHDLSRDTALNRDLAVFMQHGEAAKLEELVVTLGNRTKSGLQDNPRQFIAGMLASCAIRRFAGTNVWTSVRQHAAAFTVDIWRPFFFNDRSFPMWELLPSQLAGLASGLLDDKDVTVSLQMPTSSGKTSLCELLIFQEVKVRQRRVLFLVPFRALAAEIKAGMSGRLEAAGVRIIASYGGNIPTRSETASVEDVDVLIVTPEKFAALSQVIGDVDMQFNTIICDEGHLIDDEGRGLAYELLLTKLRGKKNGERKIVFISAILPNIAQIHAWLGGAAAGLARSDYKPVETDYAFLQEDTGKRWMLDVNPIYQRPRSYFLKDFLTRDDFKYINAETGRANTLDGWQSYLSLASATALKARRNGAVAVFTTTRGGQGIAGLATKLVEFVELGVAVADNAPILSNRAPLVQDYVDFVLGKEFSLSRLLRHGIGFHHGMLPQEIRRVMEESIENRAISILLCTSTLAEGVNLPIRTLVVHTFRRFNEGTTKLEYIPHRSIKNIIGRVGRAGKETRGRIVFINAGERMVVEDVLRDQKLEPANGMLHRLITLIEAHLNKHKIKLENTVLERQQPWFLELIDSIDHAIIDLVPEGTSSDQITKCIDELLDRTLAKHQSESESFKKCLHAVFRVRSNNLQQTIPRDSWPILKKSGASPRLWNLINTAALLDLPIWQNLEYPADREWRDGIIVPLLAFPTAGITNPVALITQVIDGWLAGSTYAEIAAETKSEVGLILTLICDDIGYHLQDLVAKNCQLAVAKHGEDGVSEIAQAWPSLLQYGLGTLQQLDLFERGASDRLGVWGIQRHLDEEGVDLRSRDLVSYLRKNGDAVKNVLAHDKRVPRMCAERICAELKIR